MRQGKALPLSRDGSTGNLGDAFAPSLSWGAGAGFPGVPSRPEGWKVPSVIPAGLRR